MTIEFHPDAAASFNSRGNSLLTRIRARSTRVARSKGFRPDIHAVAHITQDDIVGDMVSAATDRTGRGVARYFREGASEVGLEGDDYQEFVRLVESVQRTEACKNCISEKRLMEVAFDWFQHVRKQSTSATLTEYVSNVCGAEIRDYEVAVPIALLSVEVPLPVGRAVIRPITKSIFDQWFQSWQAKVHSEEDQRALDDNISRKRSRIQGYSAAFVTARAERVRAEEMAFAEAEVAAAFLRFFAPASLSARVSCFCALLGKENIQQFEAIFFAAQSLETWTKQAIQKDLLTWALSSADIQRFREHAIDGLSEIYRNPTTELHRKIVNAVLMFSRVSISHELSDKLVFLLASLESLLLKSESEAISQNLGERLALIAGINLDERKDILSTTKQIYDLRSRFLHHVQKIEDVVLMDKFMVYAWRAMLIIISKRNVYGTVNELLSKTDEQKLS